MSKGVPKILINNMDVNGGEGDWSNNLWRLKSGNFTSSVNDGVVQVPRQYARVIPLHKILAEVGRQPISAPNQR